MTFSMTLAVGKRKGKSIKKVPQRSCVGCGRTTDKRDLVRIVRTPAGVIEADPTGKKAGRGAYLCRSEQCWQQAIKRNRLAHNLNISISEEQKQTLLAYMASQSATWQTADITNLGSHEDSV